MSDHKGAGLLIDALPPACELIADRGYDSDGFRAALEGLGITPCIPLAEKPQATSPHDTALYRQRHNLFAS
jgi:transposase